LNKHGIKFGVFANHLKVQICAATMKPNGEIWPQLQNFEVGVSESHLIKKINKNHFNLGLFYSK